MAILHGSRRERAAGACNAGFLKTRAAHGEGLAPQTVTARWPHLIDRVISNCPNGPSDIVLAWRVITQVPVAGSGKGVSSSTAFSNPFGPVTGMPGPVLRPPP